MEIRQILTMNRITGGLLLSFLDERAHTIIFALLFSSSTARRQTQWAVTF